MQKIVIDPMSRVEGHLKIETVVDGGVVKEAQVSGTMFRGFELFLKGRDPWDASHAPVFAQVEGLVVDEGVSFVDLKAAIGYFARRFFAPGVKVRFRPSFFPFTEPSAEVDVECQICGGAGCPVCKGTGWSEIMGAGMVDPAVFEACGVDAERYTGYAFGMGPGRIAMQRYGLSDIRMLYDADVRLHAQFVEGR